MQTNGEISLYIHIPFCTHKCPYCHFYVIPEKPYFKEILLAGLEREWARVTPHLEGKKLASIYFGGGTPTLFEPWRIAHILELFHKRFSSLDGIEITIEANPESASLSEMEAFKRAGINRVSLGVQSLNPQELASLGRTHSAQKAIDSVFCIKEAGINNISIDLMYELPNQTLELWQETLQKLSLLPITHLSLYNLTIEPHTPFAKRESLLRPLLPDPETSVQMYLTAISSLEQCGLAQYEISAFCREGYESRHNSGYWTGRFFWGLGPSAFSYFGKKRFRNCANLSRYSKLLETGVSPVDYEEELDSAARRRELFALQLRLKKGVYLPTFEAQFGPLEEETLKTITSFEAQGLITNNESHIALSPQGILFYDTVASEFI